MRIIAGKFKGSSLHIHKTKKIRPLKDRNRKYSPLVIPTDAVIINNNGTFSDTIQQIKEQIKDL